MNVLVAPLKVVNYPFIGQLFLDNEDALKEVNDTLLDVEVIEFRDHGFLILEVALILVYQGVPLVDDVSNIVKHRAVCTHIESCKFVRHVLVFFLLTLKLVVHVFDLNVVTLKLSDNEFLILASSESLLDLCKAHGNVRELLDVCFRILGSFKKCSCLFF